MATPDLTTAHHHHHHHPHQPPPRSPTDLFGSETDDTNPLWFKPTLFLSQTFNPETYIADLRTFVPFQTLRSQLQSHLSSLHHDLVDLINRDYADFVNLSTNLIDVDHAVARMRAPLSDLREQIVDFRVAVEASLLKLQSGLRQRADVANVREVLELLLDAFHVVSKIEKLIKELPSVPADGANGEASSYEKSHLSNGISMQQAENESNVRETQSMLLERIASEMNRLKFYMAHAKDLPFIQNIEKRFQSASLLLDASLGHCFVDGLKNHDENAIYNCLRAYAAIDNTKNAEEIFRTIIIAPLVEMVIPHSSSGLIDASSGDELEADYQKIKKYIEIDCTFLLRISFRGTSTPWFGILMSQMELLIQDIMRCSGFFENSGFHVFDFLANSILKEVLLAIQKGKPGALSPGRPTDFLRNYKSSLDFVSHLEGYCTSRYAVDKFRSEAVYIDFMKQWNLGVYFSLRFQEIAGALDSALAVPNLVVALSSDYGDVNLPALTLTQSVTVLKSLRSCWSEDVLVLTCSDKFFRLSLQLLSRYSNWLSSGLHGRTSASRDGSTGSGWAISAAPEDFIYVLHDVKVLVTEITGNYLEHVMKVLSSCPTDVLEPIKQSILLSGRSLENMVPLATQSITKTLVAKSEEDLNQLKGITATFRMTNKPLPVHHSPYVLGILRPVKAFLEGERATTYLDDATKRELLQSTVFKITEQYYELASEVVANAKKAESSLLKIRRGAQRRGGASSNASDTNLSDTVKISTQLLLDIQEYGRNLAALGIDATEVPAYRSLWECVAPADKQTTISF